MKNNKKVIIVSLGFLMLFSTVVFATKSGLYQSILDRLMVLRNTYIEKESGLVEDGYDAQVEIKQYVETLELDFKNELDAFEAEEIQKAKGEIKNQIEEVKIKVNGEKDQLLQDIKDKIKEKINKDLEKELRELEKALINNN